MKSLALAAALGEVRLVNPNPEVAQDQRHRHEKQTQMRILYASVDAGLAKLAIARLDAKTLSVAFADFGGGATDAPRAKQQLLLDLLSVFSIAVPPVADADRYRNLFLAALQNVLVPACGLSLDPMKSGPRGPFRAASS